MRKNVIAAIAGAMVLCMAAAGCGSTQTGTTVAPGTADTADQQKSDSGKNGGTVVG